MDVSYSICLCIYLFIGIICFLQYGYSVVFTTKYKYCLLKNNKNIIQFNYTTNVVNTTRIVNGVEIMNSSKIKFGLDTFGDIAFDNDTGKLISYEQSIQNIVEEGKLAEKVGVDVFALGEHHRKEFSISSPEIILAALTTATNKIILGTGVTVLSSDNPIRLYQRFATLDALSNGRTQVMLGRGSFTESYALFGYDLRDYNELFEEKVALFSELVKGKPITWQGKFTPTLNGIDVFPKMTERKLDVHIGVGGTPESVIRAAKYGFPLMLAIIGGRPSRFKPYIDLYKKTAQKFNQPMQPVGIHSPGIIAESDEIAIENAWKYLIPGMDKTGIERGWAPMTKERFNYEVENGSFYIGSPETVAQKMARVIKEMGVQRFDLVYGMGGQLQKERMQTIELFGTQVIPRVKELLKEGE